MSSRDRYLVFPEEGETQLAAGDDGGQAAPTTITKPDELSWWDWTVFLLHTVAEIEHALMVQYLYAAYSFARGGFTGTQVPADAATQTARWRSSIVTIAKQEMGHLLTEQNLLRFIGGQLNLEREDFPFRTQLYPFPLALRPLSKTTLATYLAAEMPANPAVPDIDEIIARAKAAEGGMPINRVGMLFDTLIDIFTDATKLADADLHADTLGHQAGPTDWQASSDMIVSPVQTREEALTALRAIAEQGEGLLSPPPGAPPSHFDRFLAIYRQFPETETETPPDWVPVISVPVNPTTTATPDPDPAIERGRITDPTSRLWAQLFNTRYRMLLTDITHAMTLTGPFTDNDQPTLRGRLAEAALLQMRGQLSSGLRGIARKLTTRPLKQNPEPDDAQHAAPPFELPYTLAPADNERDRWRLHRALLDTSSDLITRLRAAGETDPLLDELDAIDINWRAIATSQPA